jgi:hypothetical protein
VRRGRALGSAAGLGQTGSASRARSLEVENAEWASSAGSRGALDNKSYVLRLAQALREIGEDDPHVFEIERLLSEMP